MVATSNACPTWLQNSRRGIQLNQNEMKITKLQSAQDAGFRPMTHPYKLPEERWMLDNVLADMRNGGIDVVVVDTTDLYYNQPGVEVWRRQPAKLKYEF